MSLGVAPELEEAPADDGPRILRRTPHLDIPPLKDRFQVRVYTDTEPLREGEEGEDVVVEGPPEQKRFDVDVWLVAGAPFQVEGPAIQRLAILRDQERSASVEFTVIRSGPVAGIENVSFSALFSYQGRPCGRVTRAVAAADARPANPEDSGGIRIDAEATAPDLSVRIVRGDDDRSFHCTVQAGDRIETADWRLSGLAADVVRERMARFTAKGVSDKVRTKYLLSSGYDLFEASPKIFRNAFWELIDSGRPPKTIAIVTEEPYLPWELMAPTRTLSNGESEERAPLGVEFLVSRWTSKSHIAPPQKVPLRDSWVVAPRDSRLPNAEQEAAMVLEEIPGERIDPVGIETLEEALERQGRSLLHVICHGKSGAAGSQILVLEKKEELEAGLLRAMPGVKKAFKSGKPLVFLNACEVGREEPALVGIGGFAEQFMALGASGVIAPLWSVKDSVAHELAVEFYRRLREEPETPFAEILRVLRARSYAAGGGEDTWAAYCFYGDPLASRNPARA
ncbi:MAG: CHAT domain-containing protein [Thermoanaerobaculia bacterium]